MALYIEFYDIDTSQGQKVDITGYLGYDNTEITLILNGEEITVTTDENGEFLYSNYKLRVGENRFIATYNDGIETTNATKVVYYTTPTVPSDAELSELPNNPMLNVVLLDSDEDIIEYLNPDLCNIVENNKIETCRSIELTYPITKLPSNSTYDKEWYEQGNKIYIPSLLGIDSCLYVINSTYELDYYDMTITVEAEEVLTELNHDFIAMYSESVPVNKENLEEWFGDHFNIKGIDPLNNTKNTIKINGVMSLMSLLKLIEEETEKVFIREYIPEGNKIIRNLYLKDIENLRRVENTDILDLNYNLDQIEFICDETDTYSGMVPLLTNSDNTLDNNSNTSNTSDTIEEAELVLSEWLNLEVRSGDYIPMMVEKQNDGTYIYDAYWYAPFDKEKGNLFISVPYETNTKYPYIFPPNSYPRLKLGTVSTSEKNKYAIYNVLAKSLLNKLNPSFELDFKISDIQEILGVKSQGYQLYETIMVKAPRFEYYIPCMVVETTKNPHNPGSNTIKVTNNITSLHDVKGTSIQSNDIMVAKEDTSCVLGGILTNEDGSYLDNKLITVTVRLAEAYTSTEPNKTQSIGTLNPENDVYIISLEDLKELFDKVRLDLENSSIQSRYVVRTIDNVKYYIPRIWVESLFYAYYNGLIQNSVVLHYYSEYEELMEQTTRPEYKICRYKDYLQNKGSNYTAIILDSNGNMKTNYTIT